MPPRFYLVDVFAEQRYTGNPLAVVVAASGTLTDETMQRIAAETNFSETTFVDAAPSTDGAFRVRIFTPAREIAFAGHPILGTAWVVRRYLAMEACTEIRLALSVGPVAVTFESTAIDGEIAWFRAPRMRLGQTCVPTRIATALGISTADIDLRAPVQQVSAGTAAIIVPLRSLDALSRGRLDLAAFAPLAREGFPPLVYLFSTEVRESGNDVSARFFFEAHGVREDPATGNGAAFLGAYLLAHNFFAANSLSLRIEQGHGMGRPSLVRLRARLMGATPEVQVGGRVLGVVRGELL